MSLIHSTYKYICMCLCVLRYGKVILIHATAKITTYASYMKQKKKRNKRNREMMFRGPKMVGKFMANVCISTCGFRAQDRLQISQLTSFAEMVFLSINDSVYNLNVSSIHIEWEENHLSLSRSPSLSLIQLYMCLRAK